MCKHRVEYDKETLVSRNLGKLYILKDMEEHLDTLGSKVEEIVEQIVEMKPVLK